MAGVAWPADIWLERIDCQVVVPGQQVRSKGPPHDPNPPVWRIETEVRPWSTRELGLFLDSLGGAAQLVELPLAGPDANLPIDDVYAADGDWSVTVVQLSGRFTDVTITARAGVADPPRGSMVRVGNAAGQDRLYEVYGQTGRVLHLNPRVEPPTGSTVLRRASTVTVRLDTSLNPRWGSRDIRVIGTYPGAIAHWIEELP